MTPDAPLSEIYDDLLPVSLHQATNPPRFLMLDRHNDLIAVFDESRDEAECQRIVEAANAYRALAARVEQLQAGVPIGPIVGTQTIQQQINQLERQLADAQARVTELEYMLGLKGHEVIMMRRVDHVALEQQLTDAQARADKAIKDYHETAGFMFEACDQLTALKQQHATLREALECTLYALEHPASDQQFAIRAAKQALATGAETDK